MVDQNLIKVWHILPVAAYERLLEKGWIGGDGRRIWDSFRRPYSWMIDQMKKRLGPNCAKSDYPVWVWHHPKPDLRESGWLSTGQAGYRLELLLPQADVLLSDFEAWHAVLNNWYCSMEDEDETGEKWYRDVKALGLNHFHDPLPEDLEQQRQASWNKIFEINRSDRIQGVTWRIEKKDILKAVRFISR